MLTYAIPAAGAQPGRRPPWQEWRPQPYAEVSGLGHGKAPDGSLGQAEQAGLGPLQP